MRLAIKLFLLLIIFASCNNYKTKYPYSLSDFNPKLRKHLEKIVQVGCTSSEYERESYTYLSKEASISDLQKLTECEHPLLRVVAFYSLCHKENFNIDNLLLSHLDDTAMVFNANLRPFYVSDEFLYSSRSHTKIPELGLIDKIILKHNYLIHAYTFLYNQKETNEKYYPVIKSILNRETWLAPVFEGQLLYALSKYKKQSDKNYIADRLYNSWRFFDDDCFKTISNDPDTVYFKVLVNYYNMLLGIAKRNELEVSFTGTYNNQAKFESFLSAVAAYKNKKSLEIFTQIISKKLYPQYLYSEQRMFYVIYSIIEANPGKIYSNLIKSLKPSYEKYKKRFVFAYDNQAAPIEAKKDNYW